MYTHWFICSLPPSQLVGVVLPWRPPCFTLDTSCCPLASHPHTRFMHPRILGQGFLVSILSHPLRPVAVLAWRVLRMYFTRALFSYSYITLSAAAPGSAEHSYIPAALHLRQSIGRHSLHSLQPLSARYKCFFFSFFSFFFGTSTVPDLATPEKIVRRNTIPSNQAEQDSSRLATRKSELDMSHN